MVLNIAIGAAVALVLGGGIYLIARFLQIRLLKRSLGRQLLLVRVPKEPNAKETSENSFKNEINRFEQLLGNLSALKEAVVFEVAVPHVGEEIHFYMSVPKKYAEVAAKQVQGLWSGASVDNAPDDYNIFNAQGAAAAAYLKQRESFVLPIRTYTEIEADTFGSILGGFAKVAEIGEGAALQLVIQPAAKSVKKNIRKSLEALKRGEALEKIIGFEAIEFVKNTFNPKTKEEEIEAHKIIDEEAVKALSSKYSKPLFAVNIRIITSAPSPFQANDILEGIATGFEQFTSPQRNDFRVVKPRNPKSVISNFVFREFDTSYSMILTSEGVASMFHFPTSSTETPRVKWLKSKDAPPPP
jgi:hypothetical protein